MSPKLHVAAGAMGAGVIYMATGSAGHAALFAAVEIGMDLDHVFDFALWETKKKTVKLFFKKGNPNSWKRMTYILHGHEWLAALVLASLWLDSGALAVAAMGMGTHLMMDETGNRLPGKEVWINPWFYFFTYRALNGFLTSRISAPRMAEALELKELQYGDG